MAAGGDRGRTHTAGQADPCRRRHPGQHHPGADCVFHKPIELRAKKSGDLSDLLHDLLVAQVATHLGVEPSVIDPTITDEGD
ncbi:protein of uncharacterised function (DUF1025) [Mycobacteroides abscessus]|nr:protein of uncharacterised function (DUF1025) [Mycobacteroides abscessus]